MIVAAALCPSAPLLLPRYTGRLDAGRELRESCCAAVRSALAWGNVDAVRLVAATDREPRATLPPLGRRVGEHLLGLADVAVPIVASCEIAWDATVLECRELGERLAGAAGRQLLVVIADGSARRGEKAPGHLDPRAAGLDDDLATALATADWPALLAVDPGLAADLLAHGRAPLQVLAAAAAATPQPLAPVRLDRLDPFGVQYLTGWFATRG